MIVSQNTQDALMELIKQCFSMNRFLDRSVSILGVKFAMNKSANLIHHGIAHYFPKLSDECAERCLERYNISVLYGETPSAYFDFERATDGIHLIEQKVIDFQTMMMGVCKIAFDNNDVHVYADLLDLLEDVNKITEQVVLLADKADMYGEDRMAAFDHDSNDFWILGEDK